VRHGGFSRTMAHMKNRLPILLLALGAAFSASASDGMDLAAKSKAMAAAASVLSAPASTQGRDPLPELLLRAESDRQGFNGGCAGDGPTDVCYDLREKRMVYRGARAYMPRIEGLTAENISLRHDGFVLRYSFK
jgi:hypothetical protein